MDFAAAAAGILNIFPKATDPIFKCEPIPGQLFTNEHGAPPDWIALQEEKKASEAAIFDSELFTGEDHGKVALLANAAMANEASVWPWRRARRGQS